MPRINRENMQGMEYFHIMVQGINKERIFEKEQEKNEYLKLLKKYNSTYKLDIIAYCVMGNHIHILIHAKIAKITELMQHVNTTYAKYYNKTNDRVGYVFRNRFKTQGILDRGNLFNCIIYIHNNPVKANICESPEDYKFSSYNVFFKMNDSDIIKDIFPTKEYFKKVHRSKKIENICFIDDEEAVESNINSSIDEYLSQKDIRKIELKYNKEAAEELVQYLNHVYGLSSRKISEYLDLNREAVRKIIEKNKRR